MEQILKKSSASNMEQVFFELKKIVDRLPFEEAILYEDALLHSAAGLPHFREAFGWVYELTKATYNGTHHEDNLVLYHLSIADDPAFDRPEIQQKILYEIGYSYYTIGDHGKAQVTMRKYIDHYDGPINRDLINGLTILGLIAQEKSDYKEALQFLDLAYKKATAIDDTEWIGLAGGNLGALYLDMGNVSEGLPYIYQDIRSGLAAKLYESVANDYFDLSNVALKAGDLKRAKLTLDSALILLNIDNRRYRKAWARTYQNLARYFSAKHQSDSAYHYLLLAQHITDSLQNDKNENLLRLRVNTFNQQQDDRDAVLLKASQQSSRQNKLIAMLSVLGTLLVSVFAALYIRQKKRINRILREKAGHTELARLESEAQRKKEKAANDAKDRLFSLVAHDLRGPIGSLKMVLELVQEGSITPEELQKILPDVTNRVDNLYKVTDNLLHWAYSQIGGISAKQELVSIGSLASNVSGLLKADAAQKGIDLHTEVPADVIVWADSNQLELVIRNLVSNALKFAPKNSVVKVQGEKAVGGIIIRVIDEGPGLPQEVIHNMQHGSFSNPATGTGGEKGAGLGLVMCKEFVELNAGKLSAEPNNPRGTIFTIVFPGE